MAKCFRKKTLFLGFFFNLLIFYFGFDLKASKHTGDPGFKTSFLFRKGSREKKKTSGKFLFCFCGRLILPCDPAAVAAEELPFAGAAEEPEPVCAAGGRGLLEKRRLGRSGRVPQSPIHQLQLLPPRGGSRRPARRENARSHFAETRRLT